MNPTALIDRLEATGPVLRAAAMSVSLDDARWKPTPADWSILEIVNHLIDEEVDDFRARVDSTLHHPERAWAPIDPPRWAVERRYNERDLLESADRFMIERTESIRWLRMHLNPRWENAHKHPKFGPISAADLLASWCAHDALHLRQIARRLYQLTQRDGAPASVGYAGDWSP